MHNSMTCSAERPKTGEEINKEKQKTELKIGPPRQTNRSNYNTSLCVCPTEPLNVHLRNTHKKKSQLVLNFSIMNRYHSIAMLPSQSQPLHFSLLQEKTRTITSFLCMQLPHLPTQVKKHNSENPKSQFFQKSQSSRPTIHKKTDISLLIDCK